MCFSANASFAASGVTAVAGAVAFGGARTSGHRLLAAMPLFFGLHQFAEAVLWHTLAGEGNITWQGPAMFTFLVVAKVVWPAWVPLAIRAVEEEIFRRKVLSVLLVLGVLEGVTQAYALQTYPVTASIVGGHIAYRVEVPFLLRLIVDTLYVVTVVIPPLVSSIWLMRVIGVGVLVSLIVAKVAYYEAAASVWCFFAAFISLLIVMIVRAGARRGSGAGAGSISA